MIAPRYDLSEHHRAEAELDADALGRKCHKCDEHGTVDASKPLPSGGLKRSGESVSAEQDSQRGQYQHSADAVDERRAYGADVPGQR